MPLPHRRPKTTRPRASRPAGSRLQVQSLEDRTIPAIFTATVDPAIDMQGAIAEISGFIAAANASRDSDNITLFPGGVYVFSKANQNESALPTLFPDDFTAGQSDITIDGNGARLVRSAAPGTPQFRLLSIFGSTGKFGRATISNLSLENGLLDNNNGGAVLVDGAPAVFDNVRFINNSAQATSGGGYGGAIAHNNNTTAAFTVLVRNSTFNNNSASKNGGAIAMSIDGSLIGSGTHNTTFFVEDSSFKGNKAGANGGALFGQVRDNFAVKASGFYFNKAANNGGAIYTIDFDEAVTTFVDVRTSTLHGNIAGNAGGGVFVDGGRSLVQLQYLTVTANQAGAGGGGLHQQETEPNTPNPQANTVNVRLLQNVIFENKSGGSLVGDNSDIRGRFISDGFNFYGIGSGAGINLTGQNDLFVGAVGSTRDPLLGPLQNNGGISLSRSPLPGSPLIDSGRVSDPANAPRDQRGYNRSVNGRIDVGAYEVQTQPSVVISKGDGQATAVNTLFPNPLVVTVLDPFGAPIADRAVTIGARSKNPLNPQAVFLLGNTATTDANGEVSFIATANGVNGRHFVDVTVTDVERSGTFTLYNRPTVGSVAIIGGNGQSAEVTKLYNNQLTVEARDITGAPVAGATVSLVVEGTGAGGTFSNGQPFIQVVTDGAGQASVPITANTKAGTFIVRVTAALSATPDPTPIVLATTAFTLTNTPSAPTQVVVTAGDAQQAKILSNYAIPLQAAVLDQFGNPVPNIAVTFTPQPTPDGATVSFPNGNVVLTSANAADRGIASAVAVASSKVGTFTVEATIEGVATPAIFNLSNIPGAAATIQVVSGNDQSATVAQNFNEALRVQVLDAGSNPVPRISVTFVAPSQGPSAAFTAGIVLTDDAGFAQTGATANTRSGKYQVNAIINGATNGVFNLANLADTPFALSVRSGSAQSATGGTNFAQPIEVRVIDQFSNGVSGVVLNVQPPATGPSASFVIPPTDSQGVASIIATANREVGTYKVNVAAGPASGSFTLTNLAAPPGPVPPLNGLTGVYAIGTGAGVPSRVTAYAPNGSGLSQFTPYDPGFLGGVRTAVVRSPDGVRVVTVPGPGRFPDVRIFDAATGEQIDQITPFEVTFIGGLFVSAAGDINRDGYDDYAFSADVGGGPRVQIRSGLDNRVLKDFLAIEDPNFRGGARVALGDINGDKTPDLVVSAGAGGGPRIAIYDGSSLLPGFTPRKLAADFFGFESTLRNGAYVGAGDLDGDGLADVVLGAGPGGGPRVLAFSGADLLQNRRTTVVDFFNGGLTDRGGARVTVKDLDGDAKNDLIVGSGEANGSRVTVYAGSTIRPGVRPPELRSFEELAGFTGGVFVG